MRTHHLAVLVIAVLAIVLPIVFWAVDWEHAKRGHSDHIITGTM